jgi:hypothetical protein
LQDRKEFLMMTHDPAWERARQLPVNTVQIRRKG